MPVLFDPMIRGLQGVLDLRMQQHALTASNLANAETPGFLAKVIDFREVLTDTMTGASADAVRHTDARHLGSGPSADAPPVTELEAPPWALNGNSVVPERETTRLTENSLMYDAVARGLSTKLALLRFAASDGRA
jgi:flagellar basal-body rod protein FlgB